MENINYQKICSEILNPLSKAQTEIIKRRFGLEPYSGRETLESIGGDFDITRERVRQIEKEAISKIPKEERILKRIFFDFKTYFKKNNGLKREDIALSELGGEDSQNPVYFLLVLGDPFYRLNQTSKFYTFWTIEKEIISKVNDLLEEIENELGEISKPIRIEEFEEKQEILDSDLVPPLFEISKNIEANLFGEWGLVDWPEIKPKAVRDKAYLILKNGKSPLHFTEITNLINLKFSSFSKKTAFVETVHNDLIRDERFVLVGRGIYALTEWGYQPGVVSEVIKMVLQQAGKPLTKEEIVNKVLKQRIVKEMTIYIALIDKKKFKKLPIGNYTLAESAEEIEKPIVNESSTDKIKQPVPSERET